MGRVQTAKILRIHISESERYQGQPLYEAIVTKCRQLKIAGATVFQGLEGYRETGEMQKGFVVRSDRPIVITIVDTAENIERLELIAAEMIYTGLMATSNVQMIRVEKQATSHAGSI